MQFGEKWINYSAAKLNRPDRLRDVRHTFRAGNTTLQRQAIAVLMDRPNCCHTVSPVIQTAADGHHQHTHRLYILYRHSLKTCVGPRFKSSHAAPSDTPIAFRYIQFQIQPAGINPLNPSDNYMYHHQFNIQQFCVLPTHCIYVFCVDLRTNSHYFPIQH